MTFLLNRKLRRWVEAGLITEETALKIEEHEARGTGANVTYAAVAIGALTIITGIISIIAANWFLIPSWLKLTSNVSWLCALACALGWSIKNGKEMVKEVLLLIYFGSILGSIALVGQIYHLDSHSFYALSFWLALGTPIILLSNARYPAWVWTLFCFGQWAIQGQNWLLTEMHWEHVVPVFLYIFLYVGGLFSLSKMKNRAFPESILRIGGLTMAATILCGGSFFWTADIFKEVNRLDVLYNFLLSIPIVLILKKRFDGHLAGIFLAGVTFVLVPLLFHHGDLSLVGALLFIGLCISIAHYAVIRQQKKVFEAACTLIALRIIVIYFEVFGSLLQTGVGLILSGSFILFIVWLWKTKRGMFWRKS